MHILKTMAVLSRDRSKWTEIRADLRDLQICASAICVNEELYLIGVSNERKTLKKLDKNYKWVTLAEMHTVRYWIKNSCVKLDGFIWVLGGRDDYHGNYLKSMERYDPKTNEWTQMQ